MDHHNDATTTWARATAYEPPALILIGQVANVVLGFPGGGDDHFGFSPCQFEFLADNDEEEEGLRTARCFPSRNPSK